MDATKHLLALGEEAILIECIYLQLKIEKALSGEDFAREVELTEAESLWKGITHEYYDFLSLLQDHRIAA